MADAALSGDDGGPYSVGRRAYFERREKTALARREAAAVQLRILRDNLALHTRQLAEVEQQLTSAARVDQGNQLERTRADLLQRIEDIGRELERQQRLRGLTHADRLVEWELENGHRRRPEPGEVLLARRSKRPFARRETA